MRQQALAAIALIGLTAVPPTVAAGETATLGSVRVGRALKADGKSLAPGTYEIRLTDQEATPVPAGQRRDLERWVEFVQNGHVKAREVASIVLASEIADVAEATPPRAGGQRIDVLKGGDYVRIWLHRGDRHYLIHLPTL